MIKNRLIVFIISIAVFFSLAQVAAADSDNDKVLEDYTTLKDRFTNSGEIKGEALSGVSLERKDSNKVGIASSNTFYEYEPNDLLEEGDTISIDQYVFGTITDYYFDMDYYKLTITEEGTLNVIAIYDYPEDLVIVLKDSRGNDLRYSGLNPYTYDSQTLSYRVKPGTYYLTVLQTSEFQYLPVFERIIFFRHI
jgi:hypothetical protein